MTPTKHSSVSCFYSSSRAWGYSLQSHKSLGLKQLTLRSETHKEVKHQQKFQMEMSER